MRSPPNPSHPSSSFPFNISTQLSHIAHHTSHITAASTNPTSSLRPTMNSTPSQKLTKAKRRLQRRMRTAPRRVLLASYRKKPRCPVEEYERATKRFFRRMDGHMELLQRIAKLACSKCGHKEIDLKAEEAFVTNT
ncbi:hypothetical protein FDECE_11516 [Fusarium decemcellulare]|nr:hypothetical protein FDECE_11516 [Fusarium decemcellulare]